MVGARAQQPAPDAVRHAGLPAAGDGGGVLQLPTRVHRARVSPLESAWFERLKLKSDEPLSNIAFNFQLRPYVEEGRDHDAAVDVWHGRTFVHFSAKR